MRTYHYLAVSKQRIKWYLTALHPRGAGPFSKLGGDIQIQLALAMNANGKEQECIDLFKHLEDTHPVSTIARQAANLRFIMEAPKLELGEDEKVSVPVLDLDSNKCVILPAQPLSCSRNTPSQLVHVAVIGHTPIVVMADM